VAFVHLVESYIPAELQCFQVFSCLRNSAVWPAEYNQFRHSVQRYPVNGISMSDLSAFAENIWIVEGPSVRDMGVMFTTRMTIVKLCNGSLWVDSPVSVDSETLERITELGPVRFLVAATPRHVWRLSAWHTLFPEAQLMATCRSAWKSR
jgi:hypothetical protein